MSGAFKVPQDVLAGRGQPFPQGTFVSAANKIEQNTSEDKTGLELVVTLNENSPLDGSPTVGKRPMTQRIPIVFQNQSVVDVEEFGENTPFALRRGAGLLGQLALALGVAQKQEDGGVIFDIENFLAGLVSGLYAKQAVGFSVYHRAWTSKKSKNPDGSFKSGTSAEIGAFFPAGA